MISFHLELSYLYILANLLTEILKYCAPGKWIIGIPPNALQMAFHPTFSYNFHHFLMSARGGGLTVKFCIEFSVMLCLQLWPSLQAWYWKQELNHSSCHWLSREIDPGAFWLHHAILQGDFYLQLNSNSWFRDIGLVFTLP